MTKYAAMSLAALAAVTAISSISATPALAGDDFNDWSCQDLWAERNSIYKAKGYCFNTPRGINYFGNAGCQYDSQNAVPLNRSERRTVNKLKRIENAKGC
jgi:hypothetical protein